MIDRRRSVAFVVFALFLLSLGGWAAESQIQWLEHEDEIHMGTVLEMGDEIWLVGTNVSSLDPPNAGIVVFRIPMDGTSRYPMSYDWEGVTSASDALVLPDGNILFAGVTNLYGAVGTDMYVLEIDDYGQTLSEWVIGDALDESADRILLGSHGDILVVGHQTNPDDVIADPSTPGYGGLEGRTGPYIARIQSDGQTVWKRDYPSLDNIVVFDAAPTTNGDCLVLSTVYGFPNADDAIRLDRVDETGNIKWSRTFDEGNSKGYGLHPLDSGWLLITGARAVDGGNLQAFMMMLMATGREVWSKTFGDPARISTLHEITQLDDGTFVAAGTQLSDYGEYQDSVYLVCVDFNGEMQWEKTVDTGKHVMVEGLLELSDGRLMVAGSGAAAGERFQPWLLQIDP